MTLADLADALVRTLLYSAGALALLVLLAAAFAPRAHNNDTTHADLSPLDILDGVGTTEGRHSR
ncbi:hypothetical protein [Ornithinimicrobium cerasi]|uniref:hypothetical protein n=1 Tax=Ornithinimicrobium cerasi TaxID=2248773 RepID=UPI000EFE3150|nr:hypothetical protein [Ornithinimicrobium cerasi]